MSLRALKTDEEAAAIPLDQPILVELPGGTVEGGETPEPKAKAKSEKVDKDAQRLQDQLEAALSAQRASEERTAKAERDAVEARRLAVEADKRTSALEGDLITNGLTAAQNELAAAEAELERAGEAGDYKSMAKAQSRISRASAQIVSLESGAAEVAERKTAAPERSAAPSDPMAAIDGNPNLLPAEKAWLKAHPDAVIDTRRNNELSVAYERAIKKGLVRGSTEYLDYLNDFMGYETQRNDGDRDVQAPPSRNDRGSDGRPTGNSIQLDPAERETAKRLGVSEVDYAKNKLRMQERMRADPERYPNRG